MRLHRFFVTQRIDPSERVVLSDHKLLHQWRNVLRFRVGDGVILFDGFGFDYLCELTALGKKEAICAIKERVPNTTKPSKELYLFCALIKKDRLEWLFEKATELGVSHICPIISERSEVKKLNRERTTDILREATEQSGRVSVPTLYEPTKLLDACEKYAHLKIIAFDPGGEVFDAVSYDKESPLGVCIGPEGGWSERELEVFSEARISVYSLGTATFRAETAGVAVTAVLLLS